MHVSKWSVTITAHLHAAQKGKTREHLFRKKEYSAGFDRASLPSSLLQITYRPPKSTTTTTFIFPALVDS
jgi:hypothetical protein